jgi:hypothetical protein
MRNELSLRMLSGFVLVGVFAAGALFGAGLLRWTQAAPDRLPAERIPHGPLAAMKRELSLDAEQMAKLDEIMRSHRGELELIMRDAQGKTRDVLMAIENELIPSLRPEQVKALEQWRAHRPPPPLGGPPGMGPPPLERP